MSNFYKGLCSPHKCALVCNNIMYNISEDPEWNIYDAYNHEEYFINRGSKHIGSQLSNAHREEMICKDGTTQTYTRIYVHRKFTHLLGKHHFPSATF